MGHSHSKCNYQLADPKGREGPHVPDTVDILHSMEQITSLEADLVSSSSHTVTRIFPDWYYEAYMPYPAGIPKSKMLVWIMV